METIILRGAEHLVNEVLSGFKFKETPASSNIAMIGTNHASKQLLVLYRYGKNGATQYMYNGVDDMVLNAAPDAVSIGGFIHKNVINQFEFEIIPYTLFTLVDPSKAAAEK